MMTKDECFDALLTFIDMLACMGCLSKEELEYINNIEREYWTQS